MRLKRLEVTDVRRFRGGPHVVEFHPRGTVLTGRNEAGKTTLFEAVRRALFDRSKSKARWTERIAPNGVEAPHPTVALELEHGGREIRVEKEFGAKGRTRLHERRDGAWVAVAEREEADELLLEWLGAPTKRRPDADRPDTWGAFQWLFVPQETRDLPGESTDAADRLGLDRTGVSPEFDRVRAAILAAADEVFTRTGQLAARSDLAAARAERETLERERSTLAEEVDALERKRREWEEARERLPLCEREADEAKAEWEAVDDAVVDLSGAEAALGTAEERARRLAAEARQTAQVVEERGRREEAAATEDRAYDDALAEHARTETLMKQAYDRFDAARRELVDTERRLDEWRGARADERRRLDAAEARREADEAERRLAEAERLDRVLAEARAASAAEPPAAELGHEVENLHAEIEADRRAIARTILRVSVHGDADADVLADGSPLIGMSGEGSERIEVVLPNGARVVVESGSRETARLREEAAARRGRIQQLLAPFQAESPAELRRIRDERLEHRGEVERLDELRRAVDSRPTAALAEELEQRRAALARFAELLPAADADGGDDAPSIHTLRERVARRDEAIERAEATLSEARERGREASAEVDRLRARLDEAARARDVARARRTTAGQELARHREKHGATEACRDSAARAHAASETAEAEVKERRAELERKELDARQHRETVRRTYDRLSARFRREEARAAQLEEELERRAAGGAWSRLAEVEERCAETDRRVERLEERAAALALLKETVDDVRGEAVSRVTAPIREDLEELLVDVTGGRYRAARLGEALQPLSLDGIDPVDVEDGSQGLRELVGTLVRLSVARWLAEDEPQVVVLDDPCVHVSRERTARLVERLNRLTAAGRVQVVVLTHREGEFAGLAGEVVDVESV